MITIMYITAKYTTFDHKAEIKPSINHSQGAFAANYNKSSISVFFRPGTPFTYCALMRLTSKPILLKSLISWNPINISRFHSNHFDTVFLSHVAIIFISSVKKAKKLYALLSQPSGMVKYNVLLS